MLLSIVECKTAATDSLSTRQCYTCHINQTMSIMAHHIALNLPACRNAIRRQPPLHQSYHRMVEDQWPYCTIGSNIMSSRTADDDHDMTSNYLPSQNSTILLDVK